MVHSFFVILT